MDDQRLRMAVFDFLRVQVEIHGDVLPYRVLATGFEFEGRGIPLIGQRGIVKPAFTEFPLSIMTAPAKGGRRPYEDRITEEDLVLYHYRGSDPDLYDNVALRRAMQEQVPLVYLHGLVSGQYFATWPVYVVADDPASLVFTIAVDERYVIDRGPGDEGTASIRRAYVTRLTRQRLHQANFRQRVIDAYRSTCAICRLRHGELLDAAHILPDRDPRGDPLVTNGLALCKLHHAAFDQHIVGIRPDLVIEINRRVLDEHDGPMLIHGLQGFHEQSLIVPRRPALRPNRNFLEERYERFRAAG